MLGIIVIASIVACSKDDNTQISNPWSDVETIKQAQEKAGKDFKISSYIPKGYKLDKIRIMNKDVVEINYKNYDNKISYRVSINSDSDENISGDYNEYSNENEVVIDGMNILFKGNGDKMNLAV